MHTQHNHGRIGYSMMKSKIARMAGRLKGWFESSGVSRGSVVEALEARSLMSAAYSVTNATDDIYEPADGSLRWALNQASSDGTDSSITFNLPAGTTTIELTGYLYIDNSVTIYGPGSGALSIDGNGLDRVIEAAAGDVVLHGLTITGGKVTDNVGAGIWSHGNSLTLVDVTITGNSATDTGGRGAVSVMGVGLYSSSPVVSIINSKISDNVADGGGLGIGAYFSAISPGTTVGISNSVISSNVSNVTTTTSGGVGVYVESGVVASLALTSVEGNSMNVVNQDISSLGGIGIWNNGSLTLTESTVHANSGSTPGTYVYIHGGGIYSTNTMALNLSEVSYNVVGRGPGAGVFAYGGLSVINSTIAYNKSLTTGQGAGVYYGVNESSGSADFYNVTIYGNSLEDDAGSTSTGGLYSDASKPVNLVNSVVAGNSVTSGGVKQATDIAGTIKAIGNNLVFDVSRGTVTGASIITGIDPALDTELDYHGGPTRTLVPTANSPVIDAGDNLYSTGVDQRGFPRPTYSDPAIVDLGAVEAGGILAGYVFHDVNGNGIYDEGDGYPSSGESEMRVILNSVGQDGQAGTGDDYFVDSVTQGLFGYFHFFNVANGDYYLSFEVPTGYHFAAQQLGTTGGSVVYPDGASKGDTPVYTVVQGTYEEAINAGVVADTLLQVLVYADINENGKFDSGIDSPLPGAKVTISGDSGQPEVQLSADLSGYVTFTNEQVTGGGSYTLVLSDVPGYTGSAVTIGTLGGSSPESAYQILNIVVPAGGQGTGYAFGMKANAVATASVSGSAFEDVNQNGVRDGENYIAGAVVKLYAVGADGLQGTSDDELIAETVTDGSGLYSFGSLTANSYYVVFNSPELSRLTKQDVVSVGGSRADNADKHMGSTPVYNVAEGANQTDVNAGFVKFVAISVVAFEDTGSDPEGYPGPVVPGDGVFQSYTDKALANVSVTISGVADVDGSVVTQTQTTNEYGNVYFYLLEPGTYTISVETPDGLMVTKANIGTHGGTVSNDNISFTGVTIASGGVAEYYSYAFMPEVVATQSISGLVFFDGDFNGIYTTESKDSGISGVTMKLVQYDDGGFTDVATTTTDASGQWTFTGLIAGLTYRVIEVPNSGQLVHTATIGAAGGVYSPDVNAVSGITLESDQDATGYNFANISPNIVTGHVVGVIAGGETVPLEGITIKLINNDDPSLPYGLTTTTDASGAFSFTGLRPGHYTLEATQPELEGYDFDHAEPGAGYGGTAEGTFITGIDMSGVMGTTGGENNFFYESDTLVQPVSYTFDAAHPLSYMDQNGNKVTLSMTGAGTGTAYFEGGDTDNDDFGGLSIQTVIDPLTGLRNTITNISISGSTSTTGFRVDVISASAGITPKTMIPVIEVAGDIGSIYALNASFTQSLAISGGVGSITLGDLTGGQAHLSFGTSKALTGGAKLTFGLVSNLSIFAPDAAIAQIVAKNWLDTDESTDEIVAASINALTITGAMDVDGDFMADLDLSGAGIADDAPTLNLVNVAGAIKESNWTIEGNIERITTRSGGENWHLCATGLLAYLTTSRSLIESVIDVQSIGLMSVRQHLLDTSVTTGEGLTPSLFSIAGVSVGGTVINSHFDSQNTGVGTFLITGNIMEFSIHASVLTRLNTGVSVYNTNIQAGLIGTIFVSLDMMDSSVTVTNPIQDGKVSLGNLTVFAVGKGVDVISAGSVDNMRFGHLVDSYVAVGVENYEGYMSVLTSESGGLASIKTLYLSSTIGYTDYKAMSNSNIYAGHLGSVRVYSVDEATESNYGITAVKVDSYQRRKADGTVLKLTNLSNDTGEQMIADSAGGYRLTIIEMPDDDGGEIDPEV